MLSYFRIGSQVDKLTAMYAAIGLVIAALGINMMFNHYGFKAFVLGMQARASCISLVYRKCLRLSHKALGEASPGQIVNLVSNDVSRFDQVAFLGHYLWSAPLMCILMAIFLYQEVGLAMIPGIVVVLIVAPLQCEHKDFIVAT
ncbi:hypothetical protein AAG570_001250 [Ranatra chinensis]|uniref:ABC transmembrane type-1 domain-containing protein n=1 Tax=Ranatra chinensis TaxID=642074 RepID=A0ABD0YBL3_9HEMI